MPRYLTCVFGVILATLAVGGPVGYGWYRHAHLRNVRVVQEGVLFRSGQLSQSALESLIHDYGIKTVITLRDANRPNEPPPDFAEEAYCRKQELNYFRISPRSWWAPDGSIPAEVGVGKFLAIMDDPANYPVLIHCFAGIHRTGAFCAVYRMEYQDWTNAQALAEMRALGYRDLEDEWDLLGYLEQYRPRKQK